MKWSGMLTGRNLVRSLAGVLGAIATLREVDALIPDSLRAEFA